MKIQICTGRSCREKQSFYIEKRLQNDAQFYEWKHIEIENCLCLGRCERSPNVLLDGKLQEKTNPIKISQLVKQSFISQI